MQARALRVALTSLHAQGARFILPCVLACVLGAAACAPEIGDDCSTALDCSASGSRVCDRTQPGGYCTLIGCERGTCPEEAVCVRFNPAEDRLATTYCMYRCDDSGDCREDDGYKCLRAVSKTNMSVDPKAFGDGMEAEVLGNPDQKFCAVRSKLPEPDAGVDAGALPGSDAGADAAK